MNRNAVFEIEREFRIVSLLALAVLTIGIFFYHFVEHLSFIDAFYFCVITLTTVGYGDITPQTEIGKLFTAFYVLTGVAIIATFANLLIKRAVLKRRHKDDAKIS